ncbi:hypothetical protein CQA49_08145 [Helicobacter sp. MIT 00-7814]|uniref:hypothetical protein n=1 Tax=unclassified Helicobacter TaxID=2593540 RepID=UPI000E1E844C|nr:MULTISPECIES: hypothetical protein [unclassified Helicobacter]RDU51724.1 hypothetical protein CQA37_09420 [Helicobacter sp. MIT 99-10781]RDU52576.1 hypothetical protein CQA49_08145 [Helicobacter sp. MIT 00-7814]
MQTHSFNIKVAQAVGIEKAILLQYIEFWIEKNKANEVAFYDGKYWVYHTAKAFAVIFPYLNEVKISRLLRELEKEGFLFSAKNLDGRKNIQMKWYFLTEKYYHLLSDNEKIPQEPKSEQLANFNIQSTNLQIQSTNLQDNKVIKEFIKQEKESLAQNPNQQPKSPNPKMDCHANAHNDETYAQNRSYVVAQRSEAEPKRDLFPQGDTIDGMKPKTPPFECENAFNQLWEIYPRRISKAKAKQVFARKIKSVGEFEKLLECVEMMKKSEWKGREMQYIPYLSTFLSQERHLEFLCDPRKQGQNKKMEALTRAKEIENANARAQNRAFNPLLAQKIYQNLLAQGLSHTPKQGVSVREAEPKRNLFPQRRYQ